MRKILPRCTSWQVVRKIEASVTNTLIENVAKIIIRSFVGSLTPHRRRKESDTRIVSETQSAVSEFVSGHDLVQNEGLTYQLKNNHGTGQIRTYFTVLVRVIVPIEIMTILPCFL
jgi:hypothetical protein